MLIPMFPCGIKDAMYHPGLLEHCYLLWDLFVTANCQIDVTTWEKGQEEFEITKTRAVKSKVYSVKRKCV